MRQALCQSPHVTYWHSIQKDIAFTTLCAGVVSTLVVVTQLLPHTTSTESQEKAGDGGHCAAHRASGYRYTELHCALYSTLGQCIRLQDQIPNHFPECNFHWLFLTNLQNCLPKTPRLDYHSYYPDLDQLFESM